MRDHARVDEQLAPPEVLDDHVGGLVRRASPSAGPNPGSIRPDSSIGTSTVAARGRVRGRSPPRPRPGAMWTIPVPSSSDDLVPRDDAVDDPVLRRRVVERPRVLEPDELLALDRAVVVLTLVRQAPLAVAQPVLGVGLDRRGDVGRQRPRRRRPDHERLVLALLQREAHVERRMLELLVLAGEELVLRDRGPAARAPLGRPVARVEPAALVDGLQEPPDVRDVRVRERVVVVVPVHPACRGAGLLGDHLRVLGDALLAAGGELGDPVLLDVALRVQAQRLLDLDLDPEPLAVESVLVALVEPAERLVALEDVLQRAAPGVVDAHRVVGGDRPVDEAPALAASVLLAELFEGTLLVPPGQDLPLERGVIRD